MDWFDEVWFFRCSNDDEEGEEGKQGETREGSNKHSDAALVTTGIGDYVLHEKKEQHRRNQPIGLDRHSCLRASPIRVRAVEIPLGTIVKLGVGWWLG